jgi:AraC-like DNA-binding protein
MSDTFEVNSITQAHQSLGVDAPKHPLISIIKAEDIKYVSDYEDVKVVFNLYYIMYKELGCGTLGYGKNSYDYEDGTMVFESPGQVMEFEGDLSNEEEDNNSWFLSFHPDLIRKSNLGEKIERYSFFSYDVNEALHLSDDEKQTIIELRDKIIKEYSQNLDRHSQHLIISNLELLLDYCLRFYDRQFYTRANLNTDVVSKFERLLKEYYQTDKVLELGIPTVNFCARELNLSSNYLSDLLKKETGKSAQEHIHLFLIDKAKTKLLNSKDSISEIGYQLGFEYPQHFSNLFKSKTGQSPREYRTVN